MVRRLIPKGAAFPVEVVAKLPYLGPSPDVRYKGKCGLGEGLADTRAERRWYWGAR